MFERFNNSTAEIMKRGEFDSFANKSKDDKILCVIEGDLQPYSGMLAEQEYGLKLQCQFQFFCQADLTLDARIVLDTLVKLGDMTNTTVKEGHYMIIDGRTYRIVYVADFGRGYEVLLKGVELND